MADYKLGFFGEEIDLKLQEIKELRGGLLNFNKTTKLLQPLLRG